MKISGKIKRTTGALIALAGLAVVGLPSAASALQFLEGDMGFYVYGGNTERYENLGQGSTADLAGGGSFARNIAGDLPTVQEGATLGLRYSVIGVDQATAFMYVSSQSPTITDTMRINTFADVAAGNFLQWANSFLPAVTGGLANPYANNPTLLSKGLINSFTSQLGTTGLLNGNVGFTTHGVLDQPLTIFKVNIDGNEPQFERVATALLTSNGQFTITPAAIPVPAAVILFGTGLVGLVGIARRSMK
jgi:hypothetical protein